METLVRHDTAGLWQDALAELQLQLAREDFRAWFQEADLVSYEGSTCVVGHRNPLVLPWLESRCGSLLARTLEGLVGEPVTVQFTARGPAPISMPALPLQLEPVPPSLPRRRPGRRSAIQEQASGTPSNRFTFQNFVEGDSNRLAYEACREVVEAVGEQGRNPLFLYGNVGLGKTHLLRAIYHSASERGSNVIYVTAENFMNDYTRAAAYPDVLRRAAMEDLRGKYRTLKILLVDDIEFIANIAMRGPKGTEQEFLNTFNDLFELENQIVLTSNCPPHDIRGLDERLQSRFASGLIADIQPPDLETRKEILEKKLAYRGSTRPVPPEVLDYIAEHFAANGRDLEGALYRVLAQARAFGHQISLDLAKAALSSILPPKIPTTPEPDVIMKTVCDERAISRRAIDGTARDRRTARARQIAMYLLREHTNLSLAQIGAVLGDRDHTTVLHGHAKIAQALEVDAEIQESVKRIRHQLGLGPIFSSGL